MKNIKKYISVLLIVVCVMSLFAGCGKSKGNDKVIKMVVMHSKQEDHDKVLKKANELLQEFMPGVTLELDCVSDMDQKWQFWMSSGERYDIAWSGYAFDIYSEIQKKAYMPLDDLIKEHAPNLQKEREMYESFYNSITVDDELYGIPHMQYYIGETTQMWIPAELREYMNEDALFAAAHGSAFATRDFYEALDDYFEASKKAGKWDTDTVGNSIGTPEYYMTFIAQRGYDFISGEGSSYMCYNPFDEKPVVTNFVQTEEFKLLMEYMSKWYKQGYIRKDILANAGASDGRQSLIGLHSVENWYNVDEEKGVKFINRNGLDSVTYLLDAPENKFQGHTRIGSASSYTVIPRTAQNPELAIQFLDLIHSEEGKELFNMLVYGLEGEHYDKTSEDRVEPYDYVTQGDSNSKYGIPNWMLGNLDYAWETPNVAEGQRAYAQNYNSKVVSEQKKSPLYGMTFDLKTISSELDQLTAIFDEYLPTLYNGVLDDYQSRYDEMLQKAKAAGLEKVTKELQSQADAYLSSK